MRFFAKILLFAVGLVAFIAAGAYAYIISIDVDEYREHIAWAVKETTGRDLSIAGDVSLDVFPAPRLMVQHVSLSNADWGRRRSMMTVDRLEAEIALAPLLSRTISFKRIALDRPNFLLEKNRKGKNNWSFWGEDTPSSSALGVSVSNVEIRKGRVTYLEHGRSEPIVVDIREMQLSSKGLLKPIRVRFKGRVNNRLMHVRGETGSLSTLMANDPFAVDLKLRFGDAHFTVVGGIKRPMELSGVSANIKVGVSDINYLFNRSAGVRLASLPLTGKARLRDRNHHYVLDKLDLAIGRNDVSGSVTFGKSKGRNHVHASLNSKTMDVGAFFPRKKSKAKRRVIPGWPFPAEALRSVDADIDFSGGRLVMGGVEFDGVTGAAELKSGRLQVYPRSGFYGGNLNGRLALDTNAGPPRLEAEIRGTRVDFGALLSAIKGRHVMSGGFGEVVIRLQGAGGSPRAVAASMNGRLVTNVGPARLNNSDIETIGADLMMQFVRAVNTGDKRNQVTLMQCGVVRFDIEQGIAKTERGIAAETKHTNVIGSGTINLKNEQIDIAVRTEPRDGVGLSASTLGYLMRVGGTLADPQPQMDPLGALKTGASVGAAVATSGLSLIVQSLFSRVTADGAPCKTALEGKKPKKSTSDSSTSNASSRDPSDGGRPAPGGAGSSSGSQSLGEAIKGIGESIKGLFGD